MKKIHIIIFLLFIVSLSYFVKPYNSDLLTEGFKGGRRGGGRRGGGRRSGGGGRRRHGGGGGRRGYSGYGYRGYNNPGYRGYGYGGYNNLSYSSWFNPWNYNPLSYFGNTSPFLWGDPYGYNTRNNVNWFEFRNCPSGCVANSFSPSGFSCKGNGSYNSCVTDFDCSGCNVPLVNYY